MDQIYSKKTHSSDPCNENFSKVVSKPYSAEIAVTSVDYSKLSKSQSAKASHLWNRGETETPKEHDNYSGVTDSYSQQSLGFVSTQHRNISPLSTNDSDEDYFSTYDIQFGTAKTTSTTIDSFPSTGHYLQSSQVSECHDPDYLHPDHGHQWRTNIQRIRRLSNKYRKDLKDQLELEEGLFNISLQMTKFIIDQSEVKLVGIKRELDW